MGKYESYRVFLSVAEAGSITQAAENLFLSQSAVSQYIRQLEETLQTTLFVRSRQGVALTDDGRVLFEHVRSALGLLDAAEHKLSQSRSLQRGLLTIGASDTVTSHFLLPHLAAFHRRYPQVHLQVVSGRSYKVLGLLRAGRVDMAFASAAGDDPGLDCTPCMTTHTAFVAAADYPCDFDHVYTAQELAELPLLLLERKASSRLYLEKLFLSRGITLKPEIELGARALLVDLARIGLGVAAVTQEFVQDELDAGTIRALKTELSIPPRTLDLCLLRGVSVSPAAARFRAELLEALEQKEENP